MKLVFIFQDDMLFIVICRENCIFAPKKYYLLIVLNNMQYAMKAKPFIKWVGGKGQLIEQLEAMLPADFDNWENVTDTINV